MYTRRGTVCGTQNIVDSVLRHDVPRLVYISSLSCLYASATELGQVVTEDWPLEPSPKKRGAYTLAKTKAERIVRDAVRDRDLHAVLLRPGRVFGPGKMLLTPEVARRIGNSLVILGDGTRELPLVYVEDVITAIERAAENSNFDGRVFHIVDSARITQNQYVRDYLLQRQQKARVIHVPLSIVYTLALGIELLSKFLKRPAPLSFYRVKSAMARLRFDCSRAEKEISWQPDSVTSFGLPKPIAIEHANSAENIFKRVPEGSAAK
jgi:nucleoside-diphosphate-sugar epimerase